MSILPPSGYNSARWHVEATGDTGTSHTLHPRQYVVSCEWCEAVFFGPNKDDAMRQFRSHEREMLAWSE